MCVCVCVSVRKEDNVREPMYQIFSHLVITCVVLFNLGLMRQVPIWFCPVRLSRVPYCPVSLSRDPFCPVR